MAAMFRTEFAVFGIQYSPFERHKVAVACSQYYGLVGNGKLCLLHRSPAGWSLVRLCAPVRVRAPLSVTVRLCACVYIRCVSVSA